MDLLIGNASRMTPTPDVRHAGIRVTMILAIAVSLFLGIAGAVLVIWVPYNRIVIFDQPVGTVVHISSVRLQKGGFVAVYVDGLKGSSVIGHTSYLPAGYYRDVDVSILPDAIIPPVRDIPMEYVQKNPSLFARIFVDNGDMMFDDRTDTAVNDVFGKTYSKHFWMVYMISPFVEAMRSYAFYPMGFLTDHLVP